MRKSQSVLVACSIEFGAFSGERVIRLRVTDSDQEFTGIVPMTTAANRIRPGSGHEPSPGSGHIAGFVEAFDRNGGEQATVELPSGDVVRVDVQEVPYELRQDHGDRYVPVGS